MIEVKQGQLVQIVDMQGKQVADFVAFNATDKNEYLSTAVTRSANNSVMLQKGQTLYSNRRNPMLEITDDTVGRHDTLFAACDPKRYEQLGAPGHASCRAALTEALAEFGVDYDHVPDPVNWFMNVAIRQRGELEIREPLSEPGDQVQLTALTDVVVAISACPHELSPTNGGQPTDILVRLYREAPPKLAETASASETAPAPETEPVSATNGAVDPEAAVAEAVAVTGDDTAAQPEPAEAQSNERTA